jgi:hypothetical protein
MLTDLGWAFVALATTGLIGFWWVLKSFDKTEGLRRWAEETRNNEDQEEMNERR